MMKEKRKGLQSINCASCRRNKTKQIMNLVFRANGQDPENYIRSYVENYAFSLNNSFDSLIFTESWSHMNYRTRISFPRKQQVIE